MVLSVPWSSTSLITNDHSSLIATVSPETGAVSKLEITYSATVCCHILVAVLSDLDFSLSTRDSDSITPVKNGKSPNFTLGDNNQSP